MCKNSLYNVTKCCVMPKDFPVRLYTFYNLRCILWFDQQTFTHQSSFNCYDFSTRGKNYFKTNELLSIEYKLHSHPNRLKFGLQYLLWPTVDISSPNMAVFVTIQCSFIPKMYLFGIESFYK